MMITFEKVPNKNWYAEYTIRDDGYYAGYIFKCTNNDCWNVFVRYVFTPTKGNDQFKTLKKAKEKVIEKLSMWGQSNDD